jgi:hypothetical protein
VERTAGSREQEEFLEIIWRRREFDRFHRQVHFLCLLLGASELLRRLIVPKDAETVFPRESLGQQLQLLYGEFRLTRKQSGYVPARTRQTFDVAASDRIVIEGQYYDRQTGIRRKRRPQGYFRSSSRTAATASVGCCARTGSGQPAATLPTNFKNSRRLMSPAQPDDKSYHSQ